MGDTNWSNYNVTSWVNLPDSNAHLNIFGRVQDTSHFYYIEMGMNGGTKSVAIWKNNGGSYNQICSSNYGWPPGWFKLRLNLNGSALTVSASTDGGRTFQSLCSGNDSTFTTGKVGVGSWGSNAAAYFDNVRVAADV